MRIRPAIAADRPRVLEILASTARFTPEQIADAIELFDLGMREPGRREYFNYILEEEGEALGYVCFGPTPKAEGVFDLYWIAVDARNQGRGIGCRLVAFVEREVRVRNGRMVLIETSSKESYRPTVQFYEGRGYTEISRIKDFYRIEDDKIVFAKTMTGGGTAKHE